MNGVINRLIARVMFIILFFAPVHENNFYLSVKDEVTTESTVICFEYKNSTNQLLAALVLAKAVDDVIIPEIMAVLEQSFDLIEITQEIFLEGTQGTRLLSRDEVSAIIANPALILNSGLA